MTEDNDNQDLNTCGPIHGVKKELEYNSGNFYPNDYDIDPNDGVCRDFLRNVCRRGAQCRYRHPDTFEAEELGKKIEYVFCHDYQNRECRRQNCRFLHCTKQEEEIYRSTGRKSLPQHVLEKMAQIKAQETFKSSGDTTPVCKDFLKGECRRGSGRCKFRHISQAELDMQNRGQNNNNNNNANNNMNNGNSNARFSNPLEMRPPVGAQFSDRGFDGFAPPEPKRRAYEAGTNYGAAAGGPVYSYAGPERNNSVSLTAAVVGQMSANVAAPPTLVPEFEFTPNAGGQQQAIQAQHQPIYGNAAGRFLEDENSALRHRIEELKKQVADLMATNEFLLEQNAQLRTIGKTGQPVGGPGPQTAGCPVPPPLCPPPLPPITTDLLAAQAPAAVVAASLAASLGVPQGGPIPVSSMAALSTSVISTSTTPLISYPIMSPAAIQSLRPPTIPHSLSQH